MQSPLKSLLLQTLCMKPTGESLSITNICHWSQFNTIQILKQFKPNLFFLTIVLTFSPRLHFAVFSYGFKTFLISEIPVSHCAWSQNTVIILTFASYNVSQSNSRVIALLSYRSGAVVLWTRSLHKTQPRTISKYFVILLSGSACKWLNAKTKLLQTTDQA
jgi:hypothetical protein